ncbi:TonB-dependent receptor [Muribaculum gordoncarteri]|jgi:TonB-linked SusC/RagA family outer membrane protein|uniref:TonB-dependent receptor n=10 Tax=Muribaculum TaxID=1918540 RepID=A0A4P7VEU2_9BACT|nr:TonB-dependent receptor [Muribaculum gordoncarteri]QCD34656.1 TonB-dependent receptor [Muribaculum gordoncarteri]ROT16103.1 TonB-dependent receptor [Muribaculaceae bacterium Isolate-102 (HZI)]
MENVKKIFRCISFLLLFIAGTASVYADTVRGTVVDDTGEPLIGATIALKGGSAATASDIDGNYSLQVPDLKTAVLKVSYVGYLPQEIKVNGRSTVDVTLQTNAEQLEEVVVVGYGQQKKASVVGAITQTTGEVLERAAGIHDISAALTGNLPGVVTMQSSGMPGEESAKITIRGASSWNNSDPLVLVDGIERDMNSVDVGSVKSISVLKDASATAVYGVKGANGVILITTKRGEEGRAKIDVSFTATLKSASKLPNKFDSFDALAARNKAVVHELGLMPSSWSYMTPYETLLKYRNPANLEEFERYPNVDWQDYLFKDYAMAYNGAVSISGGTRFVKYFAAIDFVHEGDLFRNFDNHRGYETGFGYNRINARSNLDFQLTKTTVFKVNLSGSNGQKRSTWPNDGSGFNQSNWNDVQVWAGAYNIAPNVFRPVYADGSYGYYPAFSSQVTNSADLLANGGAFKTTATRINTDFVLEQNLDFITKGLNFRGMISWDNQFREQGRGVSDLYNGPQYKWIDPATGAVTKKNPTETTSQFDYLPGSKWSTQAGSVSDGNTLRNLNYQLQLNWNREFGVHNVGLTGVWTRQETAVGSMIPMYREDWVFRATYNFADRYFVEYNGAYNGSEKFKKGKRFGFFNSGAIGWRVSQEKFWEGLRDWWEELKIRASYGEIGDDSGGRYLYMDEWGTGGNTSMDITGYDNRSMYTFYYLSKLGNPDAGWEKVKKFNLGIDYAFLNNMFAGSVEIFKDKRDGILINGNDRAMPSYFGQTPPTANLGKAESKGFEVEVRFSKNINRNMRVWANLSMTHAANKIIDRDDPALKPAYQKQAGYVIGQTHSYLDKGFLNSFDDIYGSPSHDVNDASRLPGDYYIVDFNGDGVVDNKDSVPYGYSGTPQNTYNATIGFEWKGFSCFAQFYGVTNVTREVSLVSFGNHIDNVYNIGDWWSGETGTGDILIPRWYSTVSGYSNGTQYLYDGSYIRLKNVELAYTFTNGWIKKLGLSYMKLYLNGNNLWVWSRMPDDRESNFSGGSGSGAYPTMRRFNFGVRFSL